MTATLRDIEAAVTIRLNLRPGALHLHGKNNSVAHPRMLAMYLGYELTRCSNSQIGRYFGKDHTTVIHARRRIKAMEADPGFASVVASCRAVLAAVVPWKAKAAASVAGRGLVFDALGEPRNIVADTDRSPHVAVHKA